MYLTEKEKHVVTFYENIDDFAQEEMKLIWKDGSSVVARFDTCFEDDNDCEIEEEEYEEFCTFVFEAIEVVGEPPIYITEADYFCVDYRNFPNEILANGEKIN